MMKEFEMTDLGLLRYVLEIQIKKAKGEIFLSQGKDIQDLFKKFQMEKGKSVATPMVQNEKVQNKDGVPLADAKVYRSLVGSLLNLTNTRPVIMFLVNFISRLMNQPSKVHYAVATRILRYLHGTKKVVLKYVKKEECYLYLTATGQVILMIGRAHQDMCFVLAQM